MSQALDRAKAVRAGEELDLEKLIPYLEKKLGQNLAGLEVEQFRGGYSNLTYLLKAKGGQWVLRRPPFGSKVKRAHDMGREYRILRGLCSQKPWAPEPLVFCEDSSILGAEFYVMKRLEGVILRGSIPPEVEKTPALLRCLCEGLLDTLVELHGIDYERAGLADLGRPEGYVSRQVLGWQKRYAASATDDVPAMAEVAAWLEENMPPSLAATIIHNDFKFDNVMYASTRFEKIVGVFDWEMATLGDPLMDVGTMLCYWIQDDDDDRLKALAFAPTHVPGMLRRQQLAERYAERTGRAIDNILFYYVFGLYKTAVVLQQIYYRYKQGLTKDPRFAGLGHGMRLLVEKARDHMHSGRIDNA